nr:transporter substrate-binding domain-containing protein [uncultured Mediterraneibacter sp.]
MKKMTILKRLGAVAVSGVLMASMLAGCGAKDSSSSDGGSKKESSSSAVEAIKERGVLKVGTEDSAIGFGYLNPDTNEWEGLEVDLGKLIADELGVDVEYTAVTTSTRGQLLDSGDLDLVAATFTITDERKLSYDFSEPYYTDAQSVLVLKSSGLKTIDDFDGKKIAMSAGGTEKDSIEAITDANIEFVEFTDFSEAKMALTAGTVDGFAADSSILLSYLDDDTMYIDTKFSPQPYGVATKKGSDLSDYVNDLVKKWAEDGTLDKLVEDNGVQPSYVEEAN